MKSQKVAVFGASSKPERYAYKAQKMLMEHGHLVYPISRIGETIMGVESYTDLTDVPDPIDTLTLYVRPEIVEIQKEKILELAPSRIIFNPGTESAKLREAFNEAGIATEEACTLVLLSTGQF